MTSEVIEGYLTIYFVYDLAASSDISISFHPSIHIYETCSKLTLDQSVKLIMIKHKINFLTIVRYQFCNEI